jgi:FkbM family methyltransferase
MALCRGKVEGQHEGDEAMTDFMNSILWELSKRIEHKASRLQGKGYESSIQREVELILRALGRPPRLAVDVGGNVGDYTFELKRDHPQLEIHVFEPSSLNFPLLKKRFADDADITIVPYAIFDETGERHLFADASGSGMASFTKRKLDHFKINFDHTETVQAIRFDHYWSENLAKRPIDLVKIDVEGHELDVLNSFGDALQATSVIQFEFGGTCIDTKRYFQDYWYFFKEAGFGLYRISPLGLCPIRSYDEHDEHFMFSNFIAVNGTMKP